MARKKSEKLKQKLQEVQAKQLLSQNMNEVNQQYLTTINTDPEYSLQVDPENKYSMSDAHKKFIENYVQFKSVATAAELSGLDMDVARQLFIAYSTQQEIRRINRALYHRQFASQLLTLDDIAGYLSSLITDENVPIADQLKVQDKLRVIQLLLDVMDKKAHALTNPSEIIVEDVSSELKDLSIDTIKQLLSQKNKKEKQTQQLEFSDDLTPEEKEYLKTLPTEQLLQLINDTNKGGESNNEQTSI